MASIVQIQRDAAHAEAARRRAQSASYREAERAQARYQRASVADELERKRLSEVAAMNDNLAGVRSASGGTAGPRHLLVQALINLIGAGRPATTWGIPPAGSPTTYPRRSLVIGQEGLPFKATDRR